MAKGEASKSDRLAGAEEQVRRVVREWSDAGRLKSTFWSEGAELCRRFLTVSVFLWALLTVAAQGLSFVAWFGRMPFVSPLSLRDTLALGLGLWVVQGSLGIWAYGTLGTRLWSRLLGVGLPIWGLTWTVHRFVAHREVCGPTRRRWSTALVIAYLFVIFLGGLFFGWGILIVDGGLRDRHVLVQVAGLLFLSGVGAVSVRRFWKTPDTDSSRETRRRRLVSMWGWWLPLVGPFWVLWQFIQEDTVRPSSKLIRRTFVSLEGSPARSRWRDARQHLGGDWRSESGLGRWFRWRDRPETSRIPTAAERRFDEICRMKCVLLTADSILVGWWWGAVGHPWSPGSRPWVLCLSWICGTIGGVGLFHCVFWFFRRGPKLPFPVAGYQIGGRIAMVQWGLFCGLIAGVCLAAGVPELALNFLSLYMMFAWLFGTIAAMFYSVPSATRIVSGFARSSWLLGLPLMARGLEPYLGSPGASYWLLFTWIGLGLFGGPALLWRHGASLVHPLRLSDLFRPNLPWRARLWLIFLPLTMVLPGGGLAVPVWVWMRLRWWKHLVAVRKTLVATN